MELRRGRSGDVEDVVGIREGNALCRLSPVDAFEENGYELQRRYNVEGSRAVAPKARRRAGTIAA
jgi:hypothetical protein